MDDKDAQSKLDKATQARTIRVERAQNGYIVKTSAGHFIFTAWDEASTMINDYFRAQVGK